MSTYAYDEVLEQVQHLTPDEKLQLLTDVAAMLRHQITAEPEHSIRHGSNECDSFIWLIASEAAADAVSSNL